MRTRSPRHPHHPPVSFLRDGLLPGLFATIAALSVAWSAWASAGECRVLVDAPAPLAGEVEPTPSAPVVETDAGGEAATPAGETSPKSLEPSTPKAEADGAAKAEGDTKAGADAETSGEADDGTKPEGGAVPPAPAGRVVVTGRFLDVNGTTEVPRGLFGTHAVPADAKRIEAWGIDSIRDINFSPNGHPRVPKGITEKKSKKGKINRSGMPASINPYIECLWDRFQPALQLRHPTDWKEKLEALGKAYGENAKAIDRTIYLEFWNEPYLNWATLPAINYYEGYYKTDDVAPGKPMTIKGTEEPVPGLVWGRQHFFIAKKKDGVPDYFVSSAVPMHAKEGETVKLRYGMGSATVVEGGEVKAFGRTRYFVKRWIGKDPEQKHYWSGPVNRRFYIQMFTAFGKALKETNPEVQLAAGWGFNFFNEDWDCWRVLIKPTIDACHPYMDALHEHHYGGDTRKVGASYEVAYAYTLARYGKRITLWNTECGGHLDPQQPGEVKSYNHGSGLEKARGAMTYMLRDVIRLVMACPDKAFARAAHHAHHNGGDEFAFKLLKPLRGKLVACEVADAPGVWAVASRNPEGALCVLLFNDNHEARTVPLRVQAPAGATFAEGATRTTVGREKRTVTVKKGGEEKTEAREVLALNDTPLHATGTTFETTPTLGKKGAARFLFPLAGEAKEAAPIRLDQYVAGEVLVAIKPGAPATYRIDIPEEKLAGAKRGLLRVVLQGRAEGLAATVNGHAVSFDGTAGWIRDLPLPADALQASNEVVLTYTAPAGSDPEAAPEAAAKRAPLACAISLYTVAE